MSGKVSNLEADLATAQAECTRIKDLLEKVMNKGKQLQQEKVISYLCARHVHTVLYAV